MVETELSVASADLGPVVRMNLPFEDPATASGEMRSHPRPVGTLAGACLSSVQSEREIAHRPCRGSGKPFCSSRALAAPAAMTRARAARVVRMGAR